MSVHIQHILIKLLTNILNKIYKRERDLLISRSFLLYSVIKNLLLIFEFVVGLQIALPANFFTRD